MLFKKDIEPSCLYCKYGVKINKENIGCLKQGVVNITDMCSKFSYDPLKRVPPRPRKIRTSNFSEKDFTL